MYTDATTAAGYSLVTPTAMEVDPPHRPPIANLYAISSLYYTPIGALVCVTVGMIVSGITGFTDPDSVDSRLKYNITDAVFCCLPESLKKWMRCGVDKVNYQDDVDVGDKIIVVHKQSPNELRDVYSKISPQDINANDHAAEPPVETKETHQ
eukprot:XP_011675610.1 PREDICTED: uncharacterized protein LOC105443745 [Strongylocentrotus purpuratus]